MCGHYEVPRLALNRRHQRFSATRTKIVDGKPWHYCEHHARWTQHTTDMCEKKGLGKGKTKYPRQSDSKPNTNAKAVRFAKAMSAIADEEDEE